MTPNSFIRLNLFMWLAKTCRVASTIENFARVSRVYYQLKTIMIRGSNGQSTEVEPQYGCYTFFFSADCSQPHLRLEEQMDGRLGLFLVLSQGAPRPSDEVSPSCGEED